MDISGETLDGTGATVTVREEVGTGVHWRTHRGVTAAGDPVAVRTLLGTVPESAYDRFDSLCRQWRTIAGRQSVRSIVGWGVEPEPWVAVEYAGDEIERLANGETVTSAQACDAATKLSLGDGICEAIRTYGRYGSTRTHLAVHPESVTFRRDGDEPIPVVGDWGVSRLVEEPPVTPYTAPEQIDGSDAAVTERTDVYRIGALMYTLIADEEPFADVRDAALPEAIGDGIRSTSDGLDTLPERVRDPIARAMAPDPGDRHASVYELQAALSASAPRTPADERRVQTLGTIDEPPQEGPDGIDDRDTAAQAAMTTTSDGSEAADETTAANHDDGETVEGSEDTEASEEVWEDTDGASPEETREDTAGSDGESMASDSDTTDAGGGRSASDDEPTGSSSEGMTNTRRWAPAVTFLLMMTVLVSVVAYGAVALGMLPPVGDIMGTGETADSIDGVVLDAEGEDAEAISDAEIQLLDQNNSIRNSTETNNDGEFAFVDLESGGEYRLSVTADDHNFAEKSVTAGETGLELTPIADDEGVTGTVVDAADGEVISEATVDLFDEEGEHLDSTTTDEEGAFSFLVENREAMYILEADADGYDPGTVEEVITDESVTIELEESTTVVEGTVRDNSDGEPIGGATITAEDDAGNIQTTETDVDGNYQLELVHGQYEFTVDADGFATRTESVPVEGDTVVQDFELDAQASWSGSVFEAGNEDQILNGAEITLSVDDDVVDEEISDTNGEFTFTNLDPVEHTAEVRRAGSVDKVKMIEFEPGEERHEDIRLTPE
ncbi:carboxypeptidase regulatory-like domain-containing protein [Halorubrum vacuolatum]|uniref:Carboxypeptidase regulatory-like domain-containing protein n=1 Tax=Halorubrum vacuolatum TaxID=63740 RepID=A0A238WRB2_HALVU|nr:carboxypeptidase regulatory-like domain-containing protein [Halorubrum vacuolatum]SNR48941.1 Carboxypeptidase regulatory-like domain-containing protein [Halorubrum vacuolatum]